MSAHDNIRDAIAVAITAALPTIRLEKDLSEQLAIELAQQASGLCLNLYWEETKYDPNEELGAVHQDEHWTWQIELLVPGQLGDASVAQDVFAAVYAAVCPIAGLRPDLGCSMLEFTKIENLGYLGDCRLYACTLTHGRTT
ncbi:MAG: hypothetical protein ABR961_03360 [Thermoanaerobaculaceae bacterium]